MHLVFYDGECGLCDHAVQFILWADKKGQFCFAPLQGVTARQVLNKIPENLDSLILVENYQDPNQRIEVLGKGALRICWLLGFPWNLIGWISFLPAFLYDWLYRIIARHRKKLFSHTPCFTPNNKRFLP